MSGRIMDKFYFLLFKTSVSQFFLKKQAHITSIFIYIHIYTRTCLCVYIYMYVSIFNLKNRNLNTCYFSSPLPFLHPLLRVTLVHPGWGGTSDRIEAKPAAHTPMGLTSLSWEPLMERTSLVQYDRANEWQCPGHRTLKARGWGQVSSQQLPYWWHNTRLFQLSPLQMKNDRGKSSLQNLLLSRLSSTI